MDEQTGLDYNLEDVKETEKLRRDLRDLRKLQVQEIIDKAKPPEKSISDVVKLAEDNIMHVIQSFEKETGMRVTALGLEADYKNDYKPIGVTLGIRRMKSKIDPEQLPF